MTIYYVTIFMFLIISQFYNKLSNKNWDKSIVNIIVIILFSIVYGFRHEVGVDWYNYIKLFEQLVNNIYEINTLEIGYKIINVIAYQLELGIVFVVFITTILFIFFSLFSIQKLGLNPYYFFAIVAPYHLVMSGVNYTRQGVALSVFLYAVSCLILSKKKSFLFFILLAGSFHTSALCFLPLFFIENKKVHLFLSLLIIVPLITYLMLTADKYQQYLNGGMDNAGLYLRALYLVPPALLLFYCKARYEFSLIERRLIIIAIYSFPLTIGLSFISTTIADRISYYFILLITLCWMIVSERIMCNKALSIKHIGNFVLLLSSFTAFTIWTIFSHYVPFYEFNSYFNYWLS